jgi:hypothetical protein
MGRAIEDPHALTRRASAVTCVLIILFTAAGSLLAGCGSSKTSASAKDATVFPGDSARGLNATSARGLAMTVLRHQDAVNRANHSSFIVKSVSCVETDASLQQFQCTTQYPNQSYVNLLRFGANNQPYTVRTLRHEFTPANGASTGGGNTTPTATSAQNVAFQYSQSTIRQLDAVCSDWDHGSRCSSCIQPLQSARIPPSVAIAGLNEYLESSITDSAGQTVFNAEANGAGNSC